MSTASDEKVWQDWVIKGKRQEEAVARKAKLFCGFLLAMLFVGAAIYRFAAV